MPNTPTFEERLREEWSKKYSEYVTEEGIISTHWDYIADFWLDRFSHHIEGIEREVVVCAAVMAEDGSIYRGHRHGHAMQACRDEGKKLFPGHEQQGFITTRNRYVSREEGRKLQDETGIPSADKEGYRGKTLFSEDLYQKHEDSLLSQNHGKDNQTKV